MGKKQRSEHQERKQAEPGFWFLFQGPQRQPGAQFGARGKRQRGAGTWPGVCAALGRGEQGVPATHLASGGFLVEFPWVSQRGQSWQPAVGLPGEVLRVMEATF